MKAIPRNSGEPAIGLEDVPAGTSVTVSCSARLHLGFFDLDGGLGRRFGSIGLSLSGPVTSLTARRAATTRFAGPERERVARYVALMNQRIGRSGGYEIEMRQAMPPHAGLGSGTQIALAVATALRRLHDLPEDLRGDADHLGRGARSGIGIGLFSHGGLVIDGGKGNLPGPPPLLVRTPVPGAWRVLLVLDREREGLSGPRERDAFAALPPMDPGVSGTICRLVLMQALPALAEQDLPAFGAAITAMQQHVGDYFAPSQGGRFTSPLVADAMQTLAEAGATGIGQSSWGPTGFAFAANDHDARQFAAVLEQKGITKRLDLLICRVLNRGASVTLA